jgi:hypothetical protein
MPKKEPDQRLQRNASTGSAPSLKSQLGFNAVAFAYKPQLSEFYQFQI